MLIAGEVDEVVVYPGAKAALVFLRPDAIYQVWLFFFVGLACH